MYNSHPSPPSPPSSLPPSPPLPCPPLPSPPLPSSPLPSLPSLPPSLPLETQQIHCPFEPKQSPSVDVFPVKITLVNYSYNVTIH